MRIIDEIEIYTEDESGLITSGKAQDSTFPTTAGRFAPGCTLLGPDGVMYKNSGTTASPSWDNVDSISTTEIAANAVTSSKIDTGVIQTAVVPLSSATIKGMFASPYTLVARVAGKTIVVDDVVLNFTPGLVAYTGGGNITVGTDDADYITPINKALILSVANGTPLCSIAKGIDIASNKAQGLDLNISNVDGAFATGTTAASITVRYHLA